MAELLDMAERTVEVTLAGKNVTATQLFIDDWIELSRQGYTLAELSKSVEELASEGKNAYELRKLIVWLGIRRSCPEHKDGLPENVKISLLEITIASRKILELENLEVPPQEAGETMPEQSS